MQQRRKLRVIAFLAIFTVVSATAGSAHAQDDNADAQISQAVTAFFQAISAPAGGKIDRAKLNSLFAPGGRITAVVPPRGTTAAKVAIMTPDQYAEGSDGFTAKTGFFDRTLHIRIERYGLMAHAYAGYESRNDPKSEKPVARGIKSFEFVHSDGKWLILQVYWDSERPDNPLPAEFAR